MNYIDTCIRSWHKSKP